MTGGAVALLAGEASMVVGAASVLARVVWVERRQHKAMKKRRRARK